jgi:hypothetical protein
MMAGSHDSSGAFTIYSPPREGFFKPPAMRVVADYALGNPWFQAEIERALGRRATRGKAGRRPKAQAEHHSKPLGLR